MGHYGSGRGLLVGHAHTTEASSRLSVRRLQRVLSDMCRTGRRKGSQGTRNIDRRPLAYRLGEGYHAVPGCPYDPDAPAPDVVPAEKDQDPPA